MLGMAVFYDRGARLVESAVKHDEARRYGKALDSYARAVEVLVKGLRYDHNSTSSVFALSSQQPGNPQALTAFTVAAYAGSGLLPSA